MNSLKQAIWIFCILIMLAGSSWYFAYTPPKIQLDSQALSTLPDAIIHQLTVHQYNEQGQLINHVVTPRLQHFAKDDQHVLDTPQIITTQQNQSKIEIHAQEAVAAHGGNIITLSKQVVITQKAHDQQPDSTLTTEELTYLPKEKLATTEKPVTLEQPGTVIHSIGMKANLATQHVVLLNQATGLYEPKHG